MNNNTDVKVSVIVPVYNTEKYLEHCLNSIRRQTFKNIEVFCVDDGSTDTSLEIMERFSQNDSRFKVLKQDNRGGGAARNYGFQQARGEYVIFWDSDDFFHPEFIELTYNRAVSKSADIVMTEGKAFDCITGGFETQLHFLRKEFFSGRDVVSAEEIPIDIARITCIAPWNKLYRKNFIIENNLYFQELPNSNDVFFSLMALFVGERISYVDKKLVYYRKNHVGNVQSNKSKEPLAFVKAYMAVRDELIRRNLYEKFERAWINVALEGFSYNLRTIAGKLERDMIFNALTNDEFLKIGILEHPADYYFKQWAVDSVKGFLNSYVIDYKNRNRLKSHEAVVLSKKYQQNLPDISVIIPVYNVGPYLEMALNSIISQSYTNIEIICINDGSTDNSLEILREFAEKDCRISVYTQQNQGLSATRNLGIEVSKGKYLYFMDGDDLLNEFALETLYTKALEDNLDVIYFDADSFADTEKDTAKLEGYADYYRRENRYPKCVSGIDMFKMFMKNKEYRVSACLQMIKRKYLVKMRIRFHEGILYEDNLFSLEILLTAEKAGHCGLEFFHRRIRGNSIMIQDVKFHNVYSFFRCYIDTLEMLDNKQIDNETAVLIETLLQSHKRHVKNFYSRLEPCEKGMIDGLPFKEKILFLELCK